ncbi:MAG: hypothetical protein JNJ80_03915 [Gemmatimonadetes bacterium]|nr:hypothetical protein [Gemmatimonadota bacterium]
MSRWHNVFRVAAAVALVLGSSSILAAQKKPVTQALVVASVAGQPVAIIPINMVVVEPTVPTGTMTADRPTLKTWTDSLLVEGALSRAPEVKWVPPAELRRISRRGAGLVPDPDQMGQSIMRSWSLTTVPDPLRSNLRKLLAIAGGARYALIPASLIFKADSTGALAADLSILLADTRTGRVVWRSIAKGSGGTPDQVLGKAVATIFPVEGEP